MSNKNVWLIGGFAVAGIYFLTKNNSVLQPVNSGAGYPYLIPGAPQLPDVFNQQYVQQYILPAMIAANSNVGNPSYTLNAVDAGAYRTNYTDINTWVALQTTRNHFGNDLVSCQYHWHTYGVPEGRTFLPLPWVDPKPFVPAQPNPKSSGHGFLKGALEAVTAIGAGVAEVATAGTLTPIIAPAAGAALSAESQINGIPVVLNDKEIEVVICGAAIAKKILPFFVNSNPELVHLIDNKINSLISVYN